MILIYTYFYEGRGSPQKVTPKSGSTTFKLIPKALESAFKPPSAALPHYYNVCIKILILFHIASIEKLQLFTF